VDFAILSNDVAFGVQKDCRVIKVIASLFDDSAGMNVGIYLPCFIGTHGDGFALESLSFSLIQVPVPPANVPDLGEHNQVGIGRLVNQLSSVGDSILF